MHPAFAHEMAMALGDEFDGIAVHAYQLADFAGSCSLPRSLVAKRPTFLINKLVAVMDYEIQLVKITDEERPYLDGYKALVSDRCDYLLSQIASITSTKL